MKVILIKDVDNLGKEGDVKEVTNGYARNFLIPNNLVKLATKKALEELDKKKELAALEAEENLKNVQALVSQIDGVEIEIPAKIKKGNEIYGSITPPKIVQALKKAGFDISKNQIILKEPIKTVGEHLVTINFEHGLEAEIKTIVAEEKTETKAKEES